MSGTGSYPNNPPPKSIMLKCILLGDGGVGKSCIMNRYVSNRFDPHSFHTIGVEFLNKEIEMGGQTYTLQVSISQKFFHKELNEDLLIGS